MNNKDNLRFLYEYTMNEADKIKNGLELTAKDGKATTVFYAMSSIIQSIFVSLAFAADQTPDALVQTKDTLLDTAAYTDRFLDAVNYVSERLNKDDPYSTTTYERKLERLISEMLFGKELGDEFVAFINCNDEDGEIIFPDKKEMKKFLRTKMYKNFSEREVSASG